VNKGYVTHIAMTWNHGKRTFEGSGHNVFNGIHGFDGVELPVEIWPASVARA
jgi:hypothetical protein